MVLVYLESSKMSFKTNFFLPSYLLNPCTFEPWNPGTSGLIPNVYNNIAFILMASRFLIFWIQTNGAKMQTITRGRYSST